VPARDRHTDKPVGFYGPIAPPGPNAPSLECPPNVVLNCEFRMCPDPEFPNVLHSEFMNTPNVQFLNVRLCSAPISYLAGSKWGRPLCSKTLHNLEYVTSLAVLRLVLAASTRCLRRAHSIGRGCRVHTCAMTIGADFKIYLLRQFCSNRVDFFTIHRRHRRKK